MARIGLCVRRLFFDAGTNHEFSFSVNVGDADNETNVGETGDSDGVKEGDEVAEVDGVARSSMGLPSVFGTRSGENLTAPSKFVSFVIVVMKVLI